MRYALYLTPRRDDPLTAAAEAWLGRSAFTGATGDAQAPIAAHAATPARYGFHGTMRAPFRLAEGRTEADLLAHFAVFAATTPPLEVRLAVRPLARFLALMAVDHEPVAAAEKKGVLHFEPLRAPLTEAERSRRNPGALDSRLRELLDTYGYPYVLERFVFHMTLTGSVDPAGLEAVEAAATAHFGALLDTPRTLVHAIFREDEPNGPFSIIATQDDLDT
ncbi:DUF1045 domain-containing protein [Acuticoccus mangrovi]|uniref:DUF1045 domain-containing protein n=1 Tax=Acuticoccus mangrovi TaxID=2796142 RepID=A0A934MFY5_9HYPH|nr:DUF1045 domain-containing protein [Acuticoccus mangrovi]MBJ3775420.1 DUF1045 domain-containing protein [Acuticoccus mangrovi]